jgi:hypothetical protein
MAQRPPAHGSHTGAHGAQRTGAHGGQDVAFGAATGRRAGVAVAGVRAVRTATGRAMVRSAARAMGGVGVDCEALTCPGLGSAGRAASGSVVRGMGVAT